MLLVLFVLFGAFSSLVCTKKHDLSCFLVLFSVLSFSSVLVALFSPPPSPISVLLVLFVLFGAFSSLVCVCVDDKARKCTKKHELSCVLVLFGVLSFSSVLVALFSTPGELDHSVISCLHTVVGCVDGGRGGGNPVKGFE